MSTITTNTPTIDITLPTAADTLRNGGIANAKHRRKLAELLQQAHSELESPYYIHLVLFPNEGDDRDLKNYIRCTLARKGIELGWVTSVEDEPEAGKDEHIHLMVIYDRASTNFNILEEIKSLCRHMLKAKLMKYWYLNPTRYGEERPITDRDLQAIYYHMSYLLKTRSKISGRKCIGFRKIVRASKSRINTGHLSRSTASFSYRLTVMGGGNHE